MPNFDPKIHHRRSIRLKEFDYSEAGAYFVTINTHQKQQSLATFHDGELTLSDFGEIISDCWHEIPSHFTNVKLDAFIVMPDHVHGILTIGDEGVSTKRATHESPVQNGTHAAGPGQRSLGAVVGQFKAASTRRINLFRGTPSHPVWHRNYYERVIRNETEFAKLYDYVVTNPMRWLARRQGES